MRKLTIIQPHKPDPEPVDPIEIDASRMIGVRKEGNRIRSDACITLCAVREVGEFAHGAIWLNSGYDWKIGMDSEGVLCAVPLERLSIVK